MTTMASNSSSSPQQPPPPPSAAAAAGPTGPRDREREPAADDNNHYFYEDEVLKFDRNGRVKFGLVMETFEARSSDTESDMELVVKKGEVRVAWHPEGIEEVIDERYIGLADRTLMPGDVVRRCTPGKDAQKGYCREVHVTADVRIRGSNYVVKNVTSDRLRPLITMLRDNAVCLDSWVGSTTSIAEKLVLKTACGSMLELRPDHDFCQLKDADTKYRRGFFAGTLFYPGQTLVGPLSGLENATWITARPDMRNTRRTSTFVVESVETEGVEVHWQCKALSNGEENDLKESQPSNYVTGPDLPRLRRLNLFESCMLQINDKNYLTIEERDIVNMTNKSQWRKERSTCYENYKILHNQLRSECVSQMPVKLQLLQFDEKCPISKSESDKKLHFSSKIKLGKHNVSTTSTNATATATTNAAGIEQDADTKKHIETTLAKMFRRFDNSYTSSRLSENDCWKTDEESNSCSDSLTTASSCSSPTPKSSPKRSPSLAKKIKKFKKRHHKKLKNTPPKVGDDVVTETVVVYSHATVVWQDGSIEVNIPSRQLYPIHHLDEHEFFPGDFVLAGSESNNLSYRDYGVIQKVDHQGRTALVKWFRTYTSPDNPRPQFFNETEVSVYDLKDHPDFQYHPGTIVIRVANFIGEDEHCTAGQVVDNYPEGLVKVWWVDGHYSMCWPQDLFEVGQYDADHNLFLNGDSDNDSWETESERSEPGSPADPTFIPLLSKNLDRARIAVNQLDEMFYINPTLETKEVMRKLLEVYKKCRFMDRLLNTSFFHEKNFMGLIERVRRGSVTSTAARVQDHKNRLFNDKPLSSETSFTSIPKLKSAAPIKAKLTTAIVLPEKPDINIEGVSMDTEPDISSVHLTDKSVDSLIATGDSISLNTTTDSSTNVSSNIVVGYVITNIDAVNREADGINNCLSIMQNYDAQQCQNQNHSNSANDSGNHTKTEWGEASYCSSTDLTTDINSSLQKPATASLDDQTSNSCCSMELTNEELSEYVCARLSALIKSQLLKAFHEIQFRYSAPISSNNDLATGDGHACQDDDDAALDAAIDEELNATIDKIRQTPVDEVDEIAFNTSAAVQAPAMPLDCFLFLEQAPTTHMFNLSMFEPTNAQQFFKALRFDHKLLKTALPPGVWVRCYEDRVDLLSVMIEGPKKTPYEGGLFLFDIQLGKDYPRAPPSCHYISFCQDRLNPNLYENGKVCVSLLGTWSGRGSEVWGPASTLLQVIVSIQGLILVAEPYFNEAGYEKQKGSQQGNENSRMYNEMVILKLLQSMSKLITNPSDVFAEQITHHFLQQGQSMYDRIKGWMDMSTEYNDLITKHPEKSTANPIELIKEEIADKRAIPEFSLVPASRGFCLTLAGLLENFRNKLNAMHEHEQQQQQQQQQPHSKSAVEVNIPITEIKVDSKEQQQPQSQSQQQQ